MSSHWHSSGHWESRTNPSGKDDTARSVRMKGTNDILVRAASAHGMCDVGYRIIGLTDVGYRIIGSTDVGYRILGLCGVGYRIVACCSVGYRIS